MTAPPPAATAPRGRGRGRRPVVLLVLGLGAAGVAAGSATWATAVTTSALDQSAVVAVTGRDAAPGVLAGALAAVAAGLALSIAGRVGARLVGLVVAAAGALSAWSAVEGVRGVRAAALAAARSQVGVDSLAADPVVGAAPWAALAVGGLTVLAGVLVLLRAGRWTAPRRIGEEKATPSSRGGGPVEEHGAWDALSRGEDPT